MLPAVVSAGVDETGSANWVDGRSRVANACAIAVTSALVPSTTMLVVRLISNAASGLTVIDAGAGINCGPETIGRGNVAGRDGAVVQAPNKSTVAPTDFNTLSRMAPR